jgi:hypothetical protein
MFLKKKDGNEKNLGISNFYTSSSFILHEAKSVWKPEVM